MRSSWIPVLAVGLCVTPAQAQRPRPVPALDTPLDAGQRAWVEETISTMSVREMAAQLILMWAPGGFTSTDSEEFERLAERVQSGVGGLWLMGGLPHDRAARINELQARAKIPLFVTTDVLAPGRDVWLLGGGTDIPPRIAYGAIGEPDAAREGCRIMAAENRAAGSTVYFDGDPGTVVLNPEGPLNTRSYGSDPDLVARLTVACLQGYRDAGFIGSVGFFPGAGELDVDPHIRLPVLQADRERLDSVEFVPYRAAIAAGVHAVMTSHFAVPALSGSETLPATLSPEIVQVLRDELGFDGMILTDAFDMGAITENYEHVDAAVRAFLAGYDILWAPDPVAVPARIAELVESGEIPRSRLEASVRRILEAKARLRLHEGAQVSLDRVNDVVGRRAHQQAADSAASRSLVLLRDRDGLVPLSDPSGSRVLSIVLAREGADLTGRGRPWLGSALDRTLRPGVESLESVRVSPETGPETFGELRRRAGDFDHVVVSVHLPPLLGQEPYWTDLPDAFVEFVHGLRTDGRAPVVLSFGKQTVLDRLPGLGTFLLAWSGADVMQRAAARALLGAAPITGRLPIALPPHHATGEGITVGGRSAP